MLTSIGALVSPLNADNDNARVWLNCVEEMTFSDRAFCIDSEARLDPSSFETSAAKQQINALQAAYMVCLYQNWEGDDTSKRRVRRYRYSTLIAVRLRYPSSVDSPSHPSSLREILGSAKPSSPTFGNSDCSTLIGSLSPPEKS